MKLHLPSSLRKALLACLAALAMPAFTLSVGSGSAFFGGAALFSLLSAESTYADFNPEPNGGWGETEDLAQASGEISFTISGTKTTTIHSAATLNFNTTNTGANFKLDNTSTDGGGSLTGLKGSISVANLWLSTSAGGHGGLFYTETGAETLFNGTQNIYVNGAQLWFRYSGATDLTANFHIGTSIRPEDPGLAGALRFSHDVTTSGNLDVMEAATITFQETKTFSVSGLNGNGALTLSKWGNNTIGTLELAGTGGAANGNFGGALTVPQGTRLRINVGSDSGGWQTIRGEVNIDGDLEFEKGELDFSGESVRNINGRLTSTGRGKITLQQASLNFNPYTASESTLGGLDIGNATANVLRTMKLTDRGLRSRNNAAVLNVGSDSANVTLTIENTKYDGNNGQYGGNLTIHEGSSLVKRGSAWQSLTGNTTINGSMVVEEGTLLLGNNNMTIGANGSITINRGATLAVNTMAKEKIDLLRVGGSGSAYAMLEYTGGGTTTGLAIEKTRGLKLVINNSTWSTWANCNILTEVELKGGQFVVTGTTTVGQFTAAEGDNGRIVVETGNNRLIVGGEGYGDSAFNSYLQVRNNATLELGSNLIVNGGGVDGNNGSGTIVSQEGRVSGLTINTGSDVSAGVTIDISGDFTKNGTAEQKFSSSLTVGGDLVINEGALTYDSNGTTTSVNVTGALRGNGGEFRIANKTATFGAGGNYSGVLVTSWSGSVVLGADLMVKGLGVFQTAVNNGGDTVFAGNIGAAEGTNVRLIINGGAGTDGTTTFSRSLTVAQNVHLIKQGAGVQRMRQATLNGALSVNGGTMLFDYGASTLNGELGGSGGTLQVKGEGVSLALNGGGEYDGRVEIADGGALTLGSDVTVRGLSLDANEASVVNGTGRLTVVVDNDEEMVPGSRLALAAGVSLEKAGEGTWKVRDVSAKGEVAVSGGTLEVVSGVFSAGQLILSGGSTLAMEMPASSDSASIAGAGSLSVSGSGNSLSWAEVEGVQTFTTGSLTGSGDLALGNLGEGTDLVHREVSIQSMENFNGNLTGSAGGESKVYLGSMDADYTVRALAQGPGSRGVVNVAGGVYSTAFCKTGEGSLSVNKLTIENNADGGGLWMDYEGTLNIGELIVGEDVVLHYTRGTGEKQLSIALDKLTGEVYGLDVWGVDGEVLSTGVCLGITSATGAESTALLQEKLLPWGADGAEYTLEWRAGEDGVHTLYMNVMRFNNPDNRWDPDWGAVTKIAPGHDEVRAHKIEEAHLRKLEATTAGTYLQKSIELSSEDAYNGGSYGRIILLSNGPELDATRTWASVIGGALYKEGEPGRLEGQSSWIFLQPERDSVTGEQTTAHYHLLVGGSSCFASTPADNGKLGGYQGATHIQMEGGEVDYIVGGNHLSNTAFVFEGKTYISLFGGKVRGSIVGGSTITSSATGQNVHEFTGSTRIAVHSVLSNDAGGVPVISAPAGNMGYNVGCAFAAIVGGNAWVGVPDTATGNVDPSFKGNSSILVDFVTPVDDEVLRGASTGNFDKAIVGGNYTAFAETSAGVERSTLFSGTEGGLTAASIIIRATDGAIFTAGVNGASRRASGGSGQTIFEGDTSIQIQGGTYSEAVAGGFWFESTTKGDHISRLTGDTQVSIADGRIWRVVGGSYSLGGGDSSQETHVGNSSVSITGGSFSSSYGVSTGNTQLDMGFVAGGNFYRNSAGSDYSHTGGTAGVTISGGHFDNIHIVGGDYVNTAASGNCAAGITGGSYVHLAAAEGAVLEVQGLVAGGSYLTDAKAGGSITIALDRDYASYATEVNIGEGAALEAEKAPDGAYRHGGVAVVAGSVIMDEGAEAGGHTAAITGGTHLLVSGGSVKGHLVGGSYANESQKKNYLSITGASVIDLQGGTIDGNIYGGHYSDNLSSPDALSMGNVSITLAGAEVNGDIVGGHYRGVRSALPGAEHPEMGSVTINLQKGRLTGNIYAAGWHNASGSVSLSSETAGTTVLLSADMQFGPAAEDGVAAAALDTWVVSGGYYKASDSDTSVVTGAAKLVFSGKQTFDNLSQLVFRDFDTVELERDITLAAGQLSVMDRGAATRITKLGAGVLTLSGGLLAADGLAYTGRIQVNNGILALGASQALDAGIGFDFTSRVGTNKKDTAYLQAVNGAELTAGKGTLVSLTGHNLASGFYYLTGELAGLDPRAEAKDIFALDKASSLTWDDTMHNAESYKYELLLKDECLVLRVHRNNPDEWIWEGEDDAVWNNESTANWSREEGAQLTDRDDVYFDAGALQTDVRIQGTVYPHNVYVESGEYIFRAYDGSSNGLALAEDGRLVVGTDNVAQLAQLTLHLNNLRVPTVELKASGKLIIEAPKALQPSTQLVFNGGVLAYGEDTESGILYTNMDMSGNVSAESTGIIRLQVGRADTALASTQTITWGDEEATRAGNAGIRHILEQGIEKSGHGVLNVQWQEPANRYTTPYTGSISVLGGQLAMRVSSSVKGGITFGSGSNISVAKGATLSFVAESSSGSAVSDRLDIARNIVNASPTASDAQTPATVVIGTDAIEPQNQMNYRLSGDNSAFAGIIELRGRSGFMTDSVRAKDANALGGKQTTLVLAGRNIVMEGDTPTVLNAGEVRVLENTVNYLGYAQGEEDNTATGAPGLAWSKANQSITITGKLTGSGTIANSRGNTGRGNSATKRDPYTHTITGDISEFTGTIVAGSRKSPAANKGFTGESNANFPGAYSASSWTLTGDTAPSAIHASFAGLGSIIIAYEGVGEAGLLIDGNIGTDTAADGVGNTVRLENRTKGTLILGGSNLTEGALIFNGNNIQLGDAKHSSTWSGTLLRSGDFAGEGSSAFVLANGRLTKAFAATDKNGVMLNVDTATNGRVHVAQTEASVFDEIAVHNGGRLMDIKGDIVAASGNENAVHLVLGFDKDSVDATAGSAGDYLINSNGGNIDLTNAVPGVDVEFEFDNESFIEVLLRHRDSGAQTFLHVLAGGGEILLGGNEKAFSDYFSSSASNAAILGGLGFKYMGAVQGDIIMSGSSKEVYLVLGGEDEWKGDSHMVTSYNVLHPYKATVVDSGQTLTINVPYKKLGDARPGVDTDGLHINNLVGLEDSTLSLQNASQALYESACLAWLDELAKWEKLSDAEKEFIKRPEKPTYEGDVTYVLSNAMRVVVDEWALPEGVQAEDLKGIDTYFEGTIEAAEGTNIRKTGAGTLYVGMQGGSGGLIMESNYYLEDGELSVRGGELRLEEGGVALRGSGSSIGSLVFAYTTPAAVESGEDRALTVSGSTLHITNSLSEVEDSYTVNDTIRLDYGGELIYSGEEAYLSNLTISSDTRDGRFTVLREKHADITDNDPGEMEDIVAGADGDEPALDGEDGDEPLVDAPAAKVLSVEDPRVGKLTLFGATVNGAELNVVDGELHFTGASSIKSGAVMVKGGLLTLSEASSMKADKVHVEGTGTVDIGSATGNTVRELTGDGILQGAAGGELTYVGDRSSTFSGTLAGTALPPQEEADVEPLAEDGVEVAPAGKPRGKGSKLTINQGNGTLTFRGVRSDSYAWDIVNNGNWELDLNGEHSLKTGQLSLGGESITHFIYDPNLGMHAFDADTFSWEKGAKLTIRSGSDLALENKNSILVGKVENKIESDRQHIDISLRGLPYLHYKPGDITHDPDKDTGVYLELIRITDNAFRHSGQHKNAAVGADFFWAVTDDSSAFNSYFGNTNTDLYKMSNALADMLDDIEEGKGDRALLDRTLAAGAGSATAVLGSALTQDLQRQLSAIRNRTTTMSAEPGYDRYGEKPVYNVWLNAESSYHKLSADGLAPGFSLNSWGGTVGVDMAFNRTTTVGIAVSAMYGDLKAESADSAKGDLDTTYISLFARKAHGAWMHTFIMSAGLVDATLNRTVNYGSGSYSTSGSTDGNALGALYELGYSKAIRADGSAILQTVFNAELRHAQINGYTERGSDAGVQVGDIEQTVLTLGAGVRAQAVVGSNSLNRSAILEGRLLAKFDAGDRSGTATTKLAKGTSVTGEVEGAEIGVMGIEIGAGITIPIGVQGSLFVDASAELRSGYTSMDANVGYRVSF